MTGNQKKSKQNMQTEKPPKIMISQFGNTYCREQMHNLGTKYIQKHFLYTHDPFREYSIISLNIPVHNKKNSLTKAKKWKIY